MRNTKAEDKSQAHVSENLVTPSEYITNPEPGIIYLVKWGGRLYPVIVLSWQLETPLYSRSQVYETLANHGFPRSLIFDHDDIKFLSWAPDYVDGQPLAAKRKFPALYIDDHR
jgi:hypothetical protein